jgi:hypothetical protein
MTNIEPKFELSAESSIDIPETVVVWATPGVSRAIRSTTAITSLVRWTDAESGNCTFTIKRPWSCCGMKPVGAFWKVQYVKPSNPPYPTSTTMLPRNIRPTIQV